MTGYLVIVGSWLFIWEEEWTIFTTQESL